MRVLLEGCKRHLITGYIQIKALDQEGQIILRAGVVDDAFWKNLKGDEAVQSLCALSEGRYLLAQRLPDLTGKLGDAAQAEGELEDIPLVAMMRHCEDEALSCTITVISGFDRGEIIYRAGEISTVILNGKTDEDSIVEIVHFKRGKFRISAPPLPGDIKGWPSVGREPTLPFKVKIPRQANVKNLDEIQKLEKQKRDEQSSAERERTEKTPASSMSSSEPESQERPDDPDTVRQNRSHPGEEISCSAVLMFFFVILGSLVWFGVWMGTS